MRNYEIRNIPAKVELSSSGNGYTARGTAIEYNSVSGDERFTEEIREGAVNFADNLYMFWQHDSKNVLGSTRSGTLKAVKTSTGIDFDCELPETATREAEAIKRGDVTGMSFGFDVASDTWENRSGKPHRIINDMTLYEISPVSFPFYDSGDIRSSGQEVEIPAELLNPEPEPTEPTEPTEPELDNERSAALQRARNIVSLEKVKLNS